MKSKTRNFNREKNPGSGLVNLTLTPVSGGRIRNVSTLSYQAYSHSGASVRKFVGDEMDKYLNAQGLVRRSLPGRLEETLFRAVSETVYHSQADEEVSTIEKRIKEHLEVERKSRRIVEGSPHPQDKLDLVRSASACYNLNIIVYYLPNRPPVVIQSTKSDDKTPRLCLYDLGHKYDFIYSMKRHESLAVAQGILYLDLYCDVFGFNKTGIGAIVRRIRKDAENMGENNEHSSAPTSSTSLQSGSVRPVIPYSAAKSIDSSIYRNVPFDLANRMLKMQKTHGSSPGNVRFPPESHCLARRGDKFECAKVIGVVEKDVRMVCFLDNAHVQLSTRDLRGRGMLYSSASQLDDANQSLEVRVLSKPVKSSINPSMYTDAVPSVTKRSSPELLTGSIAFHLPPTYYVNRTSNHNSIEDYLYPLSPKCTWWDKSLGQVNRAENQYETWSFTNQSCSYDFENTTISNINRNITPPGSDFTRSSGSQETLSPSSLFSSCEVPFITNEQVKLVDKSASFSFDECGRDLPSDINTLRYFFNLGLLTYQNKENNSFDNYQDISLNSSVVASICDVRASYADATPAPYFTPMPQFVGPMGVSMQYPPTQEWLPYSTGFSFPQPNASVLPVSYPALYGCHGSEAFFF